MTGRLIVLEGPDGVGKSTLVRLVTGALAARGQRVCSASFPGREPGSLGNLVYEFHHRLPITPISPVANQALHIAAHLDSIDRIIRPQLSAGTTVILDRFWWSTWVYGRAGGSDATVLDSLIAAERIAWGPVMPRPVILVLSALPLRSEDAPSQWHRLTILYQELAGQERCLYPVVEVCNDGTLKEVLSNVTAAIDATEESPDLGSLPGH
jgi:thymidylate kinase